MPVLSDYNHFDGQHWDTGSIQNVLAYQGVTAPHTGTPLTEALLMGISGGIAVGYFLFDYEGYDPILALLTRNTFDPMDTLLERLAIPQNVFQTGNAKKGEANLIDVLESGRPAIVWADMYSLSYNGLAHDDNMWQMLPIVVYGYENGTAHIADRSQKPLTVSVDDLSRARARIKKDKFRVVSLDPPDMRRLPAAVQKGIWQSISLFTEAPPKGAKKNFGFAALQHWAQMLTNTRHKRSWARYFEPGSRLYAALTGGYRWIVLWSVDQGAERGLYADFLDEAALILNKPDLKSVGERFRASKTVWCDLADAMLPEEVPLLKETRELMLRRHRLFAEQGGEAIDEMKDIDTRLEEIKAAVADNFPMNDANVVAMRENLRDHVLKIHDIEQEAVEALPG
jgi:hypothetical protein